MKVKVRLHGPISGFLGYECGPFRSLEYWTYSKEKFREYELKDGELPEVLIDTFIEILNDQSKEFTPYVIIAESIETGKHLRGYCITRIDGKHVLGGRFIPEEKEE